MMQNVLRVANSRIGLVTALAVTGFAGCSVRLFNSGVAPSHTTGVVEDESWYGSGIPTVAAAPLSMDKDALPGLLDVRGVGDTAVDVSPLASVARFWRGDLAFVNWESVVASACETQNPGVDYFFRSHPSQIVAAVRHGFNVFSLANNHARDCFDPYGPKVTAENIEAIATNNPVLWHGVAAVDADEASAGEEESSAPYVAQVRAFTIKGREVKVAFAAIAVQSWRMNGVAQIVTGSENAEKPLVKQLLRSLQQSRADFRILSVHTQDESGNGRAEGVAFRTLKRLGETFIKEYGGNLVFGHGPHTKAGVKVVSRNDGRQGVIFTSLGNFVHPGLAQHGDNYVGRAVFDLSKNELRFVQVLPLRNVDGTVEFLSASTVSQPNSNFAWNTGKQSYYASF